MHRQFLKIQSDNRQARAGADKLKLTLKQANRLLKITLVLITPRCQHPLRHPRIGAARCWSPGGADGALQLPPPG